MTAIIDGDGAFVGFDPRDCGIHRTVGDRAWCFSCCEWCSAHAPCVRCAVPIVRAALDDVQFFLASGGNLAPGLRKVQERLRRAREVIA